MPNVQVANLADFSGGLNLVRDAFKLAKNESPSMLNVDLGHRGGVRLRKGAEFLTASTALGGDPDGIFTYTDAAPTNHLFYMWGGRPYYTPFDAPGAWVAVTPMTTLWTTLNDRMRVCPSLGLNGGLYFLRNAEDPTMQMTTAVPAFEAYPMQEAKTAQWQEEYASLGGTSSFPYCKIAVNHLAYTWAALMLDGAASFVTTGRVRWSHPGVSYAWRSNDYIDVSMDSGDPITALISNGDHLLVFTEHCTYGIYGYSPDTFQLVTISRTVGAVSQEAVTWTPLGVVAFDARRGAYLHRGRSEPEWLFEKLFPGIAEGWIPQADMYDMCRVGYVNGRFWVTVPWDPTLSGTSEPYTFVYDPAIQGWTLFDLGPSAYHTAPSTSETFTSISGTSRIQRLEQPQAFDTFVSGTNVQIDSQFTTKWMDLGQPAVRKRWKRFEAVVLGGAFQTLPVSLYQDYDQSTPKSTINLQVPTPSTDMVWDTGLWDGAAWQRSGSYDVIVKGAALGLAKAVQLRFHGPLGSLTDWGVASVAFKYVPKKVR